MARYGLIPVQPEAGGTSVDSETAHQLGFGRGKYLTPHPNTSDLQELLKLGLFEEEGNRDPVKASAHYEKLVQVFDSQRADVATAIFRLAECSRKLGKANEALKYYQRVVAEFGERNELVSLARENIAGLRGIAPPPKTVMQTIPAASQQVAGAGLSTTTVPGFPAAQLVLPRSRLNCDLFHRLLNQPRASF